MNKILLVVLCLLILLSPVTVLAVGDKNVDTSVNSFELFWPVVSGKTMSDKIYSLKLFKEKIRGSLIFGKPQKADYSLLLATKRILEAEKLLKTDKDLSLKTFDLALNQLTVVETNINSSGDDIKSTVDNLNNKFDNLEIFLPWLIKENKEEDVSKKMQQILDKVIELHKKI